MLLALLSFTSASTVQAEPFRWTDANDYDPSIPTLSEVLGHRFAERQTTVDEIILYAHRLAEASERVELEELGRSVQGDPLLLLVITEPSNRTAIDQRATLLSTVRDPWHTTAQERAAAEEKLLPVTWIGCSVHGDEASGSEAGLLLAYHLAAERGAETQRILAETIVLISPTLNPDGRRRFINHVRTYGRQDGQPDSSPFAAEHTQLWPGGRTNHFVFDLNRDWAFLTQQETRAHVAAFLRWRPQVFVDLHEMGRQSSYFFPPPAQPINPNVPPEHRHWYEIFGRANAHAFDRRGFDYFVREDFDLFYPGYGDSWPSLQGAVGMTYEQATTRGRVLEHGDGRVVHYREAVQHHFVAALTTVKTAASHARELLDSYVRFHEIGRERAERDPRTELILSCARHDAEAARLAHLLAAQGIEVWRTREDATIRARPYDGGREESVSLPAGSYHIPYAQPSYALLRALLDLHTPMEEDFLRQERLRREKGLHSRFYDVTAWSLVLSYGVEGYVTTRRLELPSDPVRGGDPIPAHIEKVVADPVYAYLLPYEDNAALYALVQLLQADIVVGCALDGFRQGGRQYPRGSLVIKPISNPEVSDLGRRVTEIARAAGADLYLSHGAWTEEGPSLGSNRVRPLRQPRIAALNGPGLNPLSAGGLHWLLENRYGLEYTSLLLDRLEETDLRDFDVLIVPDLGKGKTLPLETLDPWVRAGGLLITVGKASLALLNGDEPWSSAHWVRDLGELADDEGMLGPVRVLEEGESPPDPDKETEEKLPRRRRPDRTPGAILRLRLDTSHYLSLGEEGRAYAPVLSDRLLQPSTVGRNVALYDPEDPRASGFMWPVMQEAIRGKSYLIAEDHGKGSVILFAEDPGFRGTWEGLHRLLLNGVLIGPNLLR